MSLKQICTIVCLRICLILVIVALDSVLAQRRLLPFVSKHSPRLNESYGYPHKAECRTGIRASRDYMVQGSSLRYDYTSFEHDECVNG